MSKVIAIEGMDGAGKSTQMTLLKNVLEEKGYEVLCLHEPGGTRLGEIIRDVHKHSDFHLNSYQETMLMMASRNALFLERILPALIEGTVVLLDRFYLTTLSYQAIAGDGSISLPVVSEMLRSGGIYHLDALTILLDVDCETSIERSKARGSLDRLERADVEVIRKRSEAYRDIAAGKYQLDLGRIKSIPVDGLSVEQVSSKVLELAMHELSGGA